MKFKQLSLAVLATLVMSCSNDDNQTVKISKSLEGGYISYKEITYTYYK